MDGQQPLTCLSCNAPLFLPNISPSPLYNLCLHFLHNSQHGRLYLSEPMEAAATVNYVNVSPVPWLSGDANFMPTYIDSMSTTVMLVVQRTGGTGVWILAHAANVLQGENMIRRVDNTIDLTLSLQGTGGTDARLQAHVANVVEREIMMGREENPIDLTLRLATPAEEANLTLRLAAPAEEANHQERQVHVADPMDDSDEVDFLSCFGSSGTADQPNE